MRISRKGFILRFVLIYLPLIGFFGWKAIDKYQQQNHLNEQLIEHNRTITLPDGRQLNILEVTPEEAQELFGIDPSAVDPAVQNQAAKHPSTTPK